MPDVFSAGAAVLSAGKIFSKKVRAIPRAGKHAASRIAVETYAMYLILPLNVSSNRDSEVTQNTCIFVHSAGIMKGVRAGPPARALNR
jgi:hypothetical protein